MAATESTSRAGASRDQDARIVVLAEAGSPTERALLADWVADFHPAAELVDRDDPGLAQRLNGGHDPLVVPARVTWLPGDHEAGDLRALLRPRRPPARVQRAILRRAPGRARVTEGQPAHARVLHEEFEAETGGTGGDEGFAAFVRRRATLACDRAERPLIGDRYKVPRLVAEQIAASARLRDHAEVLATKLGRPAADVLAELTADLEELAAVQSPPAIDAFRAAMAPLHRRAWNVIADTERLEELRELNKTTALVFLPSHRSYADPLVLADVLHANDFPRDHVLGGNNLSFWPIGPLGKRAGLIFIRRSFGDDQVYKLAVREYFHHLVAKRFNLEWYIEGGRSRTGKLRPPRYGLLAYLVRALDEGNDVTLVPVAITYEQLQEVGAMAAEQRGAKKSAEGLGWLAGYIRAQRRNVGTVRVRFDAPLSLRQALEDAGEGPAQLEKVAFRICNGINRATPVTSTALVTFALLSVRDRALTLRQVTQVIAPLLDHLEARDIPGPAADLRDPEAVAAALSTLVDGGVVSVYAEGSEPVWSIAPDRHHVAAFYRNGMLHHVLNRAIIELVVLDLAERRPYGDAAEAAWQQALRYRDLLKFEFFFKRKTRYAEEIEDEARRLGWDGRRDVSGAVELMAGQPVLVANGALRSFVDAQYVVASRLVAHGEAPEDRDAFLDECLAHGRQLLLQGRVQGADSVSRELFATALRQAANRGGDPRPWLDELVATRALLDRIAAMDAARLEGVLDGHAR